MAKYSKNIKKSQEAVDRLKFYDLVDAVKILKDLSANYKMDQSIEIAINTCVDIRHADQNIRGMTELPNGTGKNVTVLVFARDDKAKIAEEAGADHVGAEDLAAKIQNGELSLNGIDRCIATPDMMPVLGRLGKILGPRGLMPNPKLGTVTPDVKKAVESAKGGAIEFRAEKSGIIHAGVGKMSFGEDQLLENVRAFVRTIQKARPTGAKGQFILKVTVSSTLGPGIKLDLSAIAA